MTASFPVSDYFDDGRDLTDPALYGLRSGSDVGAWLPSLAYRSAVFAALEDERIWMPGWVCIGTDCDVPDTGDLLPYTVGVQAIHVQRDAGGGLVARYNKAQHGGCRFVPVQCQTGTKTSCSFTCCGYSRDRATIKGASLTDTARETYQYLGLRPERLPPAPLARLGALLFVNLDPSGPGPHGLEDARSAFPWLPAAAATREDARWHEPKANWKLMAQQLAAGRVVAEDADGRWRHGRPVLDDGTQLDVVWMFPNLLAVRAAEWTGVIVLQPTAVAKTLCRVSVFAPTTHANNNVDTAPFWRWLQARGEAAEAMQDALSLGSDAASAAARDACAPGDYLARLVAAHVLRPQPGFRPAAIALIRASA